MQELTGWLALASGEAKYTVFNAKAQESTHIFIVDYEVPDACSEIYQKAGGGQGDIQEKEDAADE